MWVKHKRTYKPRDSIRIKRGDTQESFSEPLFIHYFGPQKHFSMYQNMDLLMIKSQLWSKINQIWCNIQISFWQWNGVHITYTVSSRTTTLKQDHPQVATLKTYDPLSHPHWGPHSKDHPQQPPSKKDHPQKWPPSRNITQLTTLKAEHPQERFLTLEKNQSHQERLLTR